jgi:hypothetical protein
MRTVIAIIGAMIMVPATAQTVGQQQKPTAGGKPKVDYGACMSKLTRSGLSPFEASARCSWRVRNQS